MRIFRASGSKKHRKLRKQHSLLTSKPPLMETIPSIGSELAASDQFEIIVATRRDNNNNDASGGEPRRKTKNGFFSYFSSDNDDSTMSSITTIEYGGFFQNHTSNNNKRSYSIKHATNAADRKSVV